MYYFIKTRVGVSYHIQRHDAKRSVLCDKTRLTSVFNGFKKVTVRSPHWRSDFENGQRLN